VKKAIQQQCLSWYVSAFSPASQRVDGNFLLELIEFMVCCFAGLLVVLFVCVVTVCLLVGWLDCALVCLFVYVCACVFADWLVGLLVLFPPWR
jgi:hypothetical protein